MGADCCAGHRRPLQPLEVRAGPHLLKDVLEINFKWDIKKMCNPRSETIVEFKRIGTVSSGKNRANSVTRNSLHQKLTRQVWWILSQCRRFDNWFKTAATRGTGRCGRWRHGLGDWGGRFLAVQFLCGRSRSVAGRPRTGAVRSRMLFLAGQLVDTVFTWRCRAVGRRHRILRSVVDN